MKNWWFYGGSMVVLWWFYGSSMVVLWWFYGGSMVVLWFKLNKGPGMTRI